MNASEPIPAARQAAPSPETPGALVRDRMSSPAITVASSASLAEVARILERARISAVPVVEHDRILGVLSATDILSERNADDCMHVAASVRMSSPAITARPDERLDEAAWRMIAARVHRLVVADGDRAVGVLSARDALAEVAHRKVAVPIREIMTTPVESVSIDDTIDDALSRLAAANVHGLIVVDGMSPVGVFTQTEALAARKIPSALRAQPVESVMSYETICLDAATPTYRAAGHALAMNVRRILVVEQRRLVGILSCVDLLAVLARGASVA